MLKTLENLQLFAHKKVGGSTSNGRDSQAKRLGAKAADGQTVSGGSILYRQRGTHIYPGVNEAVVVMIHSSLKLKVLYVSNVKVATKNKYLYTQLLNNSAKVCTFV